ncbi:MAG: polysaccharide biosynthesis protein [Lachnospiraceae bacterium]|nr:polysaccharide biosynthesis protein [Lachnospiraceae bacterium]
MSRVENASRNVIFGILLRGYQVILPFIIRTVMLYYMGIEYLGLNSLFGSILWVLNLAELGVGSAMVYSMYQPIIDKDEEQICALLKLYRTYYRVIGAVIAVVGVVITPLIPMLIKTDTEIPSDIDIYVVYYLNLFCTVMTYWLFAYKNSLLMAHQRTDISSKVTILTNTILYGAQILIIIFLRDYYMYLVASIVTQIINNFLIAYWSKKMYPQYSPKGELDKITKSKITQRIKDLFTMKLGNVIVSTADSIVISMFLGLSILGIYNNYYYIITAVMSIVKVFFVSAMAGIGNSILVESEEKNYVDLKKFTFIIAWITGFCSVCLLCLYQPFMTIWTGKDLLLGFSAVVCFVIYFYVDQFNQLFLTYKDAAGIWHEDRFRPIITALVNLALNIILVQVIGIYGVLLSTVISVVAVGMPWILHNIFTTIFSKGIRQYVTRVLLYTFVTVVVSLITYLICALLPDGNLLLIILKLVAVTIVSNLLFLLSYHKLEEFGLTKDMVMRIIKRKS